jgi:biopolymer transport protein ExbD
VKALNQSEDEFALNLTPLIDVVFQLIIFFLVSTTLIRPEKSIDVVLPSSDEARSVPREDSTLVVNVRETGVVVVEGRVLADYDELVGVMRAAYSGNPSVEVQIRGDRRSLHEHVVRVMNAALAVGIQDMAINVFETEPE